MIKDIYLLKASKEFTVKPRQEVRIDLKLRKKKRKPCTRISGTVFTHGVGVSGATVKILDRKLNPVTHATTGEAGGYLIEGLPPGDYKIMAAAVGFAPSSPLKFSMHAKQAKLINLEIRDNPAGKKGFVYGIVKNNDTGEAIDEALITLLAGMPEVPLAKTTSNGDGQFLLCNIVPGQYCLLTTKPGYVSSPIIFQLKAGEFLSVDVRLDAELFAESKPEKYAEANRV